MKKHRSLDDAMEATPKVFVARVYAKTPANPEGRDLLGHPLCYLQNGAEILDTTKAEMPLEGFEEVSTADMKMQMMIQRELNKRNLGTEPLETVEDSENFDLSDELEKAVKLNPALREHIDVKKFKKEFVKRKQEAKPKPQSQPDNGARPVDNDQSKSTTTKPAAAGPTEGAGS